jgi:hypothetical protein
VNARRIGAVAAAIVLIASLAGCAPASAASLGRAKAITDVSMWTRLATAAVSSPPAATTTKFNAFESCRNDNGYIKTSSQWRTITNLAVPSAHQAAATTAIARAFAAKGWKVTTRSSITTVTGPIGSRHKGMIVVETGGKSLLYISVVSPCYR